MAKILIVIVVTVLIELFLGFIIIKNPSKFIGEGKPDFLIKLFIFIILTLMIVVLMYLTISAFKG